MPVFGDSENRALVPEGDYIYCVSEVTSAISQGGKTSGSTRYDVEFELQLKNGQSGRVYETLIDHPSTAWKIDTFLKSAGIQLKKGETYEFTASAAESQKCRFIDPVGLRGWCRIIQDEYKDRTGAMKRKNKIATFYTDKPKMAPRKIEKPTSVGEEDDQVPF